MGVRRVELRASRLLALAAFHRQPLNLAAVAGFLGLDFLVCESRFSTGPPEAPRLTPGFPGYKGVEPAVGRAGSACGRPPSLFLLGFVPHLFLYASQPRLTGLGFSIHNNSLGICNPVAVSPKTREVKAAGLREAGELRDREAAAIGVTQTTSGEAGRAQRGQIQGTAGMGAWRRTGSGAWHPWAG